MNKLNVFYETEKIGELIRDEERVFSFRYTKDWLSYEKAFPLSLSLPLEDKAFGNKVSQSFFENLLPEGEVRDIIGRTHQVEGVFDFLKEYGQDCAGAIVVTTEEASHLAKGSEKVEIDMEKIYQAITEHRSVVDVIADMNPGYLSLAGAQDKFPAIIEGDKFYLPKTGGATTHIVKAPIFRHGVKESVFNEYYCMELARAVGFDVPACRVIDGDAEKALYVIERYDRYKDATGTVHRIHQQDFCQAQGIMSDEKYESRGGPGIAENYNLIKKNVTIKKRLQAAQTFLDWIAFNLLIGNNDSHSKNISFLLKEGKIELAPFYDLLATCMYPKLKRNFSFLIGDRDDFSRIGRNQFQELEKSLEIKPGAFTERVNHVCDLVLSRKAQVAEKIHDEHAAAKIPKRISEEIEKRYRSLKIQKAI
jgi:serine/threonine-protein kinase HipA